ncbi:MAG: carbohydrate ABC transporter permease [Caldilineaceae bacterium]|nr:carbohydrate ABC transporter permease [Caldilineaceae bacterium]
MTSQIRGGAAAQASKAQGQFVTPSPLARLWNRRQQLLLRLVLWVFLLAFLLPFVWAVSASLKTRQELYVEMPSLITLNPTLANYFYVLRRMPAFLTYFQNSAIVTVGATVLQVVVAALAGYAFARLRFPARDLIFYSLILLTFVPRAGGLMVQYELMSFLGLRNSQLGLILAFAAGVPIPIFIMRQTFLNLPHEFEDAALIDGANRFQAFLLVMLPMATGGMLVVGLFEFIRVWGEYLFTLTMIDDPRLYTLGIGIAMQFIGLALEDGEFTSYGAEAAVYLLTSAPVLILFVVFQRMFIRGMMEGLKL